MVDSSYFVPISKTWESKGIESVYCAPQLFPAKPWQCVWYSSRVDNLKLKSKSNQEQEQELLFYVINLRGRTHTEQYAPRKIKYT